MEKQTIPPPLVTENSFIYLWNLCQIDQYNSTPVSEKVQGKRKNVIKIGIKQFYNTIILKCNENYYTVKRFCMYNTFLFLIFDLISVLSFYLLGN